jgi:hypothetical protein
VYFEIATQEGVAGVATLAEKIPAERILFGSHAPFFYFDSAVFKLMESGLPSDQLAAIARGNAERILQT